jgi:hypothetical protein
MRLDSDALATRARKIEWNLAGCPSGVALSAVKTGVETGYVGDFEKMATFSMYVRSASVSTKVNRRIFWLDSGVPGRVDVLFVAG